MARIAFADTGPIDGQGGFAIAGGGDPRRGAQTPWRLRLRTCRTFFCYSETSRSAGPTLPHASTSRMSKKLGSPALTVTPRTKLQLIPGAARP